MEGLHQLETVIVPLGAVLAREAIARRVLIPYPIFLVLGGLVLSVVPNVPVVRLDPDLGSSYLRSAGRRHTSLRCATSRPPLARAGARCRSDAHRTRKAADERLIRDRACRGRLAASTPTGSITGGRDNQLGMEPGAGVEPASY
jgi:hypothetical protein